MTSAGFELETPRLRLRSWRDDDVDAFHVVNSDPEVMATLGPVMNRDEVAAMIVRLQRDQAEHGCCFWAMERAGDGLLIGWCGVKPGNVGPIDGKPEIGWRMRRDCWGHGYVSEAARATLDWLFANRDADAAWAITTPANVRSRAVMERLGMACMPQLDFDHPRIPTGDPLARHVTYRIGRDAWTT